MKKGYMAVIPIEIAEGVTYITEENSIGYSQIKEVLKITPDKQDSLYDTIEYRAKSFEINSPWVMHKCMRKTFAGNINRIEPKKRA